MTTRYQEALQAYADGRYEEAMQQFSELLYEDPRNPKLHIWLGATFRKAGKIEYARVQYQQVLTLTDDPDLVDLARTSLEKLKTASSHIEVDAANNGHSEQTETLISPPPSQEAATDTVDEFDTVIPPPPQVAAQLAKKKRKPQPAISQVNALQPQVQEAEVQAPPTEQASEPGHVEATAAEAQPPVPPGIVSPPAPKPQKIKANRPPSLKGSFSGWAIALATIPVLALGISTYQSSYLTTLEAAKQSQEVQANSLVSTVNRFMLKQYESTQILGSVFSSPDLHLNVNFLAQKQVLLYRLNLYKQAFKNFDSIAIFDLSGNLIVQSAGTPTPNVLDPETAKQITAINQAIITKPVLADQSYVINFATPILHPITGKLVAILQARMPLEILQNNMQKDAKTQNFFVVDGTGKYVVGNGTTKPNNDAIADFNGLGELQSARQPGSREIFNRELGNAVLAYAPTNRLEGLPDLNWGVAVASNRDNLLGETNKLVLLIFIASVSLTPVLVGAIFYALSHKLSASIKMASQAVRKLSEGNLDTRLDPQSYAELEELSQSINSMAEQFQSVIQQQRLEKQRLQLQVMKLFKALQRLAQVEASDVKISDDSIGLMFKKIQTALMQKQSELNRERQEKEKLQQQLVQVLAEVKDIARGDLTVKASIVEGDISEIAEFFNAVIDSLRQIVGQVKSTAGQVSYSLGQNEQAVSQLANLAIKQADEINRTLNSIQLMTLSVQSVADSTRKASEVAHSASTSVESGSEAMERTMQGILNLRATVAATAKKVKRLGESSQRISKVVSLINEIAVQTNFLAINASIEASRAGDEGKGFAVVAEEVGELAARSAAATREIEQLIGSIQTETSEVVTAMELGTNQVAESTQLVEDAKKSLLQITEVSKQIDELVQSISEATVSQAQTSECISGLMKDIAQVSGRTATSSREVSKSLHSTLQVAEQLQAAIDKFKVESVK